MNERLTEIYRSCRSVEALASQDQFKAANVLMGSEVEQFAEKIIQECIQAIKNESMDAGDEWERGLMYAEKGVKERFGVES